MIIDSLSKQLLAHSGVTSQIKNNCEPNSTAWNINECANHTRNGNPVFMRLMSSPVGRKFSHLASLEESWAPSWRGVRCHLGEPAPRATNWSKITPTWRASNSIRCELAHQRCVSKRATGLIISALSVCNSISQLLERAPLCVCVHPLSWYIDHHLSISVCGVVNTWVITETLSNIDLSWKSKQRQRAHSLWHAVLLERAASCTIHYTRTPPTPTPPRCN